MAAKTKTNNQLSQLIKESKTKLLQSKKILLLAGILTAGLILFYSKSLFLAATVNNKPITRISIIKSLEKRFGKQTLDDLIIEKLILQEAGKKNIEVTQAEIEKELEEIKKSFDPDNFEKLLNLQGMTEQELKNQIKTKLIIDKLVKEKIEITDKEIDEYIANNDQRLPEDEQEKREEAKTQLRQQKMSEELPNLIARLKQNANINYFVNY